MASPHQRVTITLNLMYVMRSLQTLRRLLPGLVAGARSQPVRFAAWALAAILALAAATAYAVALWKAPDWMHATASQARYNARVLVISVGGAIVVGTGLLYTARNYRLSRRGQVTDRFTVALERLGSTELYVRIGGIHALEHVMRDSPTHHNDVIEVLIQFIRGHTPDLDVISRRGRHLGPPKLPRDPAPDVQAALTALAHRPFRPERQPIDLRNLHLTNAKLWRANLTWALLDGANLTGAELPNANLSHAQLSSANLTGAYLNQAILVDANLAGANLTHTDLPEAKLTRAWLSGYDNTTGAINGANLAGTNLQGADLTGAYLNHINLTGARLTDADLTRAFLGGDDVAPRGWVKVTAAKYASFRLSRTKDDDD